MKHLLLIWLILGCCLTAASPAFGSADDLLQEAKLAMFDGRWSEALEKLRSLRTDPTANEPLRTNALFYEARALEKLNRRDEALPIYEAFLSRNQTESALSHEARFSTVRLAVELYRSGNRRFVDRAVGALTSQDKSLRLMAAIQLSYVADHRLKRMAVPILLDAIEDSADPEALNQATLALLRIDPTLLEKKDGRQENQPGRSQGRSLHVTFQGPGGESFRLNLPVSLARLVLTSLPDEARASLEEKGVQLDKLVEELSLSVEVVEIKTEDGLVRIWID